MLRGIRFFIMALILVLTLLVSTVSCAASVSDGECDAVQADLDRANAELDEAKAKVSETKAALDKAKAELVEVKVASLEELLRQRRSVRDYADEPLTDRGVAEPLLRLAHSTRWRSIWWPVMWRTLRPGCTNMSLRTRN